jgi:hypothetical protein
MEISKTILEFWRALDPAEIYEWEELARDIRNGYVQLGYRFGIGTIFDGYSWEEHRNYYARSLFFKWMGYQTCYATNDTIGTYTSLLLT